MYEWSKEIASAYGYVAMIKRGLRSSLAAFVAGYGYIYQYWVAGAAGFGILGVSSFLYLISPSTASSMPWLWAVLVVVSTLIVTYMMWRGVKIGGVVSLIYSMITVVFLIITSAILVILNWSRNTLSVFTPAPVGWSWTTVFVAMILGASIFGGLTTPVGVAEEAKMPKSTLKKALMIEWIIIAIALILSAYSQTIAYGPSNMFSYASLPDPLIVVYNQYFGPIVAGALAVLVAVSFVISALAFATSGSRMVYGMARDGVLYPRLFTSINSYGVPGNAILLTGAVVAALSLIFGYVLGPLEAALFLLTFGSFFIYFGHIFASISLIAYSRKALTPMKVFTNIVIPAVSAILYILVLYFATYPAPTYPLNIAVYAAWAVVVAHIIIYYIYRARHPDIMSRFGDYTL
ncbi:MAG: APC family permease [Nitrososphaeria archaeon]